MSEAQGGDDAKLWRHALSPVYAGYLRKQVKLLYCTTVLAPNPSAQGVRNKAFKRR